MSDTHARIASCGVSVSSKPTSSAPANEPFESAWLKWAWGVRSADVLLDNIRELAAMTDLEVYLSVSMRYEAKRHCIVLVVDDVGQPFPDLWGLLLGDVVHNWRCALDHIAWALYKRGTANLSERRERDVSFPIFTTRTAFNDSLKKNLPGVKLRDTAVVRRYQPYLGGKRRSSKHVLLVLQELSNADKHRFLQPVIAYPKTASYTIVATSDCIYRRLAPKTHEGGAIEPGAELVRFYVKKTGPEPRIQVAPHFSFTPAIRERFPLEDWLHWTARMILNLLREFGEPPASASSMMATAVAPGSKT